MHTCTSYVPHCSPSLRVITNQVFCRLFKYNCDVEFSVFSSLKSWNTKLDSREDEIFYLYELELSDYELYDSEAHTFMDRCHNRRALRKRSAIKKECDREQGYL